MNTTGSAGDPTPLAPAGRRVRLDASVQGPDAHGVLVGGAPMRVLRLTAAGAERLAEWSRGEPVGESVSERALAARLLAAGIVHPDVADDPSTESPPFTVVVPVRDDVDGVHRLLARLRSARGLVGVVVVDDGSVEPFGPPAGADAPDVRVVRHGSSRGPGAARMAGLAEVDTELVLFLDADVEIEPEAIELLLRHFDDPTVAAAAPRVRSRLGPSLLDRYESDHSPLDLGDRPGRVGPKRRVAYVPSAALMARVAAVRAAGGFDPTLRYGEDVDLIWRLADAGHHLRYEPAALAHHRPRPNWRAWWAQRRHYGASAAALATRHGDRVAPARATKSSLTGWLLVLLGRPLIGAVVAIGGSKKLVETMATLPGGRRTAARVFVVGQAAVGNGVAGAVRRVWWPLLLPATVVSRRARLGVAVAIVGPGVRRWWHSSRRVDPVRATAIGLVDDLAYGAGVWEGCLRARSLRALAPDVGLGLDGRTSSSADTVARS